MTKQMKDIIAVLDSLQKNDDQTETSMFGEEDHQLVFKDVDIPEKKNDGWTEALKLKKENRRLKNQLEDVDSLIHDIIHALDLGPDNDWARSALGRYSKKYYER